MTNMPKPDLERGAYIVYTDEPGDIVGLSDNASDSFSITDYNGTYVATDPDALMQPTE